MLLPDKNDRALFYELIPRTIPLAGQLVTVVEAPAGVDLLISHLTHSAVHFWARLQNKPKEPERNFRLSIVETIYKYIYNISPLLLLLTYLLGLQEMKKKTIF